MSKIAILTTLACILVPAAVFAATHAVYIRAGEKNGYGMAFSRGADCFVVTAAHVVTNHRGKMEVLGIKKKNAQAKLEAEYPDDIAILRISENSSFCEDSNWPETENMKDILSGAVDGVLRSMEFSGSIRRIPVFIMEAGGHRNITIRPRISDYPLHNGLSGSLLLIDENVAGILLDVNKNGNEGRVFRMDRIAELIAPYLPDETPSRSEPSEPSTGWLRVTTHPPDADVKFLNSDFSFHQGIELPPGEYRLQVSAQGFKERERSLNIRAGVEETIDVRLERTMWIGGNQRYVFAGGPGGGTFQAIADGIQSYPPIQNRIGISVLAQPSGGSVENLRRVNSGRSAMGIVYQGQLWLGREGLLRGDPRKYDKAMAVAWLYSAPAQLVVKKQSGIRSVRDLAGRRVGVGNAGSIAFSLCEHFFTHMGVWDKIERNAMGYSDSAQAFINNQLDAFWVFSAFPNTAISMAAQENDIALINLGADGEYSGFFQRYPFYTRTSIPGGAYRGVNNATPSYEDNTLWVANADVPESVVYNLLSVIYTDGGLSHLRGRKRTLQSMGLTTGARNIVTPFHPGARQFWKDKGMLRN
jgi:TRAP transporter TAXI family solute receptor